MSKAKKKSALHREKAVAAEETYTALTAMEENLRRLGLREELESPAVHLARSSPSQTQKNSSDEYLASIRKSREEAAKLRYEKEYRQFASEEQKRENELMLSTVNESKVLYDVIKKAHDLLERETHEAELLHARRMQDASERAFRAQHLDRMRAVAFRVHDAEKVSLRDSNVHSVSPFFDASLPVPSAKARAKALATWAYCERIATGLVELAVRVSDNQYGADGVRRVPQDLAVRQWHAWVDTLLFPPPRPLGDVLAASSLRDLRDGRPRGAAQDEPAGAQAGGGEQEPQQRETEQGKEPAHAVAGETKASAARVLRRVSSLNAARCASLAGRGVADALRQLRAAEFACLREDLDAVRSAGTVLPEAVPGWARRLPPVASVVFGDELSGARALAEAAQRNADAAAPCRVIVPAMLVRVPASLANTTGGGGGGGGAGAKGARRADAIGAPGSVRGKQTDETTELRIYYESLSDALVWEMVAVYQHNCLALAREAQAAEAAKAQMNAAAESVTPHPHKNTETLQVRINEILSDKPSGVNGAEPFVPPALRSLVLVCFPEADAFWRVFLPALSEAIEHAVLEMERVLRGDASAEGELPEKQARGRKNARKSVPSSRARGAATKPGAKNLRRGQTGPAQGNGEADASSRLFAFPPLCITGVFLQFDILSRFVRLRGAVQGPGGMHHPIFAPDPTRSSPSPDEEGGTGCSSTPYLYTCQPNSGVDSCGNWPMDRMRRELVEQDRRMRRMWDTWSVTVARASVIPEPEPEKPATLDSKKRTRSMTLQKSSDTMRHAASPTATSQISQSLASQLALPLSAAKPAAVNFPRLLLFRRRADISTSLQQIATSTAADTVEALMDVLCTQGGTVCVRNTEIVPGLLPAPLHIGDYRLVPAVLAQLVETHTRATARWESATATALGKRAPGAKLSCSMQDEKEARSNGVDFALSQESTNESDPHSDDENAVWAEMEVFRAFRGFATELLRFMNGVFPPSLWVTDECEAEGFSRTTHFTAVDRNYESSREALYKLLHGGSARLVGACALLLRYKADMALRHVADALVQVCAVVQCQMEPSTNVQQELQQTSVISSEQGNIPHSEQQLHQHNHHVESYLVKTSDDVESSSSHVLGPPEWKPGRLSSSRVALDQLREHFFATVPVLSSAEAVAMITQLGGQPVTLDAFRLSLRAYATRVEDAVTECFRSFLHTVCAAADPKLLACGDSIAPKIARTLLSYSFATGESGDESNVPCVSVSLSRVAALVHAIRRCFTVTGRGAARWIDAMYVVALAVPPQGIFPSDKRPVNICSVLAPPAPVVQQSGVPPLSLALERVEAIAPPLDLSSAEEREFWRETEVEIVLQCFSIYQKSQLDEAEFMHCAMLSQIGDLWPFLPSRANELAARVKFDTIFNMDSLHADGGIIDDSNPSITGVSRLAINALMRVGLGDVEGASSCIASETDIARLFHGTFRVQQQLQPDGARRPSTIFLDSYLTPLSHSSPSSQASGCPLASQLAPAAASLPGPSPILPHPRISLREFFMSALLQRCYVCDTGQSALGRWCCANAVREPSVSELRAFIRSLPRAVSIQRHNVPARGAPLTAKEWASVKWWPFSPDKADPDDVALDDTRTPAREAREAFQQRLLLRVLTVCFAFADVALCARCVPFLPDVLALAARTRGSQATLERFFHAFAALHGARDGDGALPDGRLALFCRAVSVEDALFFHGSAPSPSAFPFPSASASALRGPCVAPGGHLLPDQRRAGAAAAAEGDEAEAEAEAEEAPMTLEVELRLLLVAEDAEELTLPLLGASHGGRRLVPRLAAVPQDNARARRAGAAEETGEDGGLQV